MYVHFDMAREQSRELYKETVNDNIDGQIPCLFHSQIELYFVDDGQIDAFVNHHKSLLHKGQMAVVLGYDAHLFRTVEYSKSSILVIPPNICREFAAIFQHKQVKNPFICNESTVQQIKSIVEQIRTNAANDVKLKGYLYLVLGIVLENIFLETAQGPADTELSSQILFYLNQNFRQEISLDTLACKFGYSQSYLSRYFKEHFGIGLSRYLNILRLRNALLLLQEGTHTHTYCALESGFSSMRTFYRVFRQEFGCAPKDYIPLQQP